ncbi:MAG: (Fe-S)-binding protein [Proteobacteria bacterium]|nr:(Fe-S)-binding protein [Pseudomonadota bacterium]
MNQLIDPEAVESIRSSGKANAQMPDRIPILEKYNLPYDQPAKNVLVSGCQVLPNLPHLLEPLARLFDKKGLSYTMLSTEYCCGNYLYRPAIKAKDEAAMEECRELSKEFAGKNIEQAEKLGAKRLIIFCSPCYPIYKYAFPDAEIVFYPAVINELLNEVRFEDQIDYYAGCYRLHRKFSPAPMDLKSTNEVFDKIKGLEINRISAPKCCFHPEGLAHMMDNVSTRTMVHVCTGCYSQALNNLPEGSETQVMMLPSFVEKVLGR